MEWFVLGALALYLLSAVVTALLIRRRAPSFSLWIAALPVLNMLAADLTGLTQSHRFDATSRHSAKVEQDRNAARNGAMKPPI